VLLRGTGDQRLLEAAYHIPAMAQADSAPLRLLADILGSTPGGRLHHALVEGGLAAGAGASADWLRDPGLFVAHAVLPAGADPAKARDALLAQVEDLAAHPVTQAELDDAKRRIGNGFDLYFTDVNAVGMGLATFVAAGDWRLLFLARDAIAAATVADVNRVAAAYLRPANRTLAEFVPVATPDPVKIPAATGLAERAAAYAGRKALDAGEDFEPTLANIDARVQRFTIGDGLEVRLLPKRTRGGTVTVDADFRFGDERSLAASPEPAGSIAGAMLMRGSASMDRARIAARFTALETQARVSGGAQGANITLLSRHDRLADALALAADVLRHPAFPEGEFEQLRMQAATGIEAGRREPGGIASLAMARHFDPWPAGHPLRVKAPAERLAALKALSLDAVRAFHRDFYGTSRGTIAIVGDFDPAAVRTQLQALFADWVSPKPYAPIDTHYTAVKAERQQFETPGKSNAVLLARLNLPLRVTDPDYPAMLAANDILGGSTMKSRLGDRIRQKEGLSYGVRSQLHGDDSLDGRDYAGSLEISAIAAPQNMAKVEAAVREELARLAEGGVTAGELQDSVNSLLAARRQSLAVDGNIAAMLDELAYFHRDIGFEQDMQARIAALTVADVNAVLRKRLHPEDLSVYVAGDFAGAAAGSAAASGGPAAPGSGAFDALATRPGGQ
jgi:zinc protease